ncbi:hypothetical protein PMAYCL1PPCAC_14454, partial [Pristionchus mayeri]
AAIFGEKLPKFVIYGESVQAAHALCAQADPGKCLVSNAVRTSVTKTLDSVYVFSSRGCVEAGSRKIIAHDLERHARLSSAQLAGRKNKMTYRASITAQEIEQWESHCQLADQAGQIQVVRADSKHIAARFISQSWKSLRMLSNRSNDSGF